MEIKSLRRRAVGQAWTLADMVLAILIGASEQRVYAGAGYDAIDGMDFRAWLKRHGAREYTVQSPLVRIIYDAAFSYPNGGQSAKGRTRATQRAFLVQSMAAGAALRIIVWMFFTYKGSLFFKMRAGMGEVIHVPLYHLLRARGVKFKFLHRVKGLTPGIDAHGSPVIDQVHLDQIARPRKGNEYHPLVHLKDADVWPFEPIKEEINEHDYEAAQHCGGFSSVPRRIALCACIAEATQPVMPSASIPSTRSSSGSPWHASSSFVPTSKTQATGASRIRSGPRRPSRSKFGPSTA